MSVTETSQSVTREQLDCALVRRKTMSHLRLGDALVQENLITAFERDTALAMQRVDSRKPLGEILVENGAVTREELRRVLAEQLGVPSVDLTRFRYDPHAVEAVSASLARKHMAMPLYRTETRIAVAIENPLSWEALTELELFTGLKVDPAMAGRGALQAAIAQFYGGVAADEQHAPDDAKPADNTLVWLANRMIGEACDQGTFDIHIESIPGDQAGCVRFRVDGVLVPRGASVIR